MLSAIADKVDCILVQSSKSKQSNEETKMQEIVRIQVSPENVSKVARVVSYVVKRFGWSSRTYSHFSSVHAIAYKGCEVQLTLAEHTYARDPAFYAKRLITQISKMQKMDGASYRYDGVLNIFCDIQSDGSKKFSDVLQRPEDNFVTTDEELSIVVRELKKIK